VLHEPDLHAVFWIFPNDRRLRGLELLRDDATPPRRLLGGRWARTRLVSYAPERAATAECRDEDGALVAYAKMYAGDAGRRSAAIHARLHDALSDTRRAGATCLRLPRVLRYDDARRLVLVDPLPGRRLDALDSAERRAAISRLGAALAALHTLPAPDGPAFARFAPAHVHQGARLIGRMCPDAAHLAGRLAESLVRHARDAGPGDACLHGDIGMQNWMADGDSVSIIDLDQSVRGPAGADIGGVLANLRTWPLAGRLTPDEAATLADDFLAGYGAVRPLPSPSSIRWHTAAALLVERGVRAVNRVRLDLLPWLPTILSDAHTLLG